MALPVVWPSIQLGALRCSLRPRLLVFLVSECTQVRAANEYTDLYYISFPKDRCIPKALVAITLSLETLQLVLSTRDGFINLASGWGNMQALDAVGWQWFSLPILMVIR